MIVKTKISVKGMHCHACEMLIVDSLEDTEGVANATASHESSTVDVNFDESKIALTKIKKIIQNEGYVVI